MNIKIVVATHKKYQMPSDTMYLPLHVGREGKTDLGYIGDNTGQNISLENSRFCELTGIYWAWKNLRSDYIGLVHYRRYFTAQPFLKRFGKEKFNCILTRNELTSILKKCDLVVPKLREYGIENIYSHFIHLPYAHEKDIQILRNVICELQPEYLKAFDTVMIRTHAHMFNMFIMKWEYFDAYCRWLFPILLEADRRIDVSNYTPMEARVVAYFGEFMIDVWNEKQQLAYYELPVIFMEKQNWFVKGGRFILRKIFPKHNIGG